MTGGGMVSKGLYDSLAGHRVRIRARGRMIEGDLEIVTDYELVIREPRGGSIILLQKHAVIEAIALSKSESKGKVLTGQVLSRLTGHKAEIHYGEMYQGTATIEEVGIFEIRANFSGLKPALATKVIPKSQISWVVVTDQAAIQALYGG